MPLLQLPPEIFERISYFLVRSLVLDDISQYRTVCKTFNQYLTTEMCERMSRMPLYELFHSSAHRRIFRTHGALILTKRVMRGDHEGNSLLRFVQNCVSFALSQGMGKGGNQGMQRLECTSVVCSLLSTLRHSSLIEYLQPILCHSSLLGYNRPIYSTRKIFYFSAMSDIMPAVAAALDNTEWLLKHVTSTLDLLLSECEALPSALDTAVLFQNERSLSFILWDLLKIVREVGASTSSSITSRVALGVSDALRLAVRLHKTRAGGVIFDFIIGHKELHQSTWKYLADDLLNDCVKHGNFALLLRAFHYKHWCFTPSTTYLVKNWVLSTEEYELLYRRGHPELLRFLLKHKLVDSNLHNPGIFPRTDTTPLMMALENERYDLARVLIQNGADVNAKSEHGCGETALVFAVRGGLCEKVRFLLCNGADIAPTEKQEDDALWVARQYRWPKCLWILEKAESEGIDYIRHKGIWTEYYFESFCDSESDMDLR